MRGYSEVRPPLHPQHTSLTAGYFFLASLERVLRSPRRVWTSCFTTALLFGGEWVLEPLTRPAMPNTGVLEQLDLSPGAEFPSLLWWFSLPNSAHQLLGDGHVIFKWEAGQKEVEVAKSACPVRRVSCASRALSGDKRRGGVWKRKIPRLQELRKDGFQSFQTEWKIFEENSERKSNFAPAVTQKNSYFCWTFLYCTHYRMSVQDMQQLQLLHF